MKAILAGVGAALVLLLLPLALLFGAATTLLGGHGSGAPASAQAVADIPADVLRDYQEAAQTCTGLSWTVLAGVGKVESDHGRSQLPGVHAGQNSAGAMGPMQMLPGTWAAYHVAGLDDVYRMRDAAFAAAHYLCANGAGVAARLRAAIWAYNHAWWYVDEVMGWATRYAADAVQAPVGGVGRAGDPFAGACTPVVTQPYGPTSQEGEPIIGGVRFHTGIDLACAAGVPIHSLTDGIAHVTSGWGGGFGNNVVVEAMTRLPGDLFGDHYFIRYAHLDAVLVADGVAVHAGDLLGLEGSSGFSSGPHLHFEIDRGAADVNRSINPAPLLEVS